MHLRVPHINVTYTINLILEEFFTSCVSIKFQIFKIKSVNHIHNTFLLKLKFQMHFLESEL